MSTAPLRAVPSASSSHYPGLGNQVKKRGLLELYRERLLQCVVEDASQVVLSKSARAHCLCRSGDCFAGAEVVASGDYEGSRDDRNRDSFMASRRDGPGARATGAGAEIVSTKTGRLPCLASAVADRLACRRRAGSGDCSLFQRLVDHVFELGRQIGIESHRQKSGTGREWPER